MWSRWTTKHNHPWFALAYHLFRLIPSNWYEPIFFCLNADLEVKTRTIEGAYLNLQVTSIGKLTWIRISGYPKLALKEGQSYNMFKITANTPLYSVYRRINISPTLGIVFSMSSADAEAIITPFGGDISTTTGVNVSECYIMK